MDDNAIHEWLIKCFGPIQGEMAWQQISQLPEEIRETADESGPQPTAQSIRSPADDGRVQRRRTQHDGRYAAHCRGRADHVKLAKSIALQQANASGSASSVSAVDGEALAAR